MAAAPLRPARFLFLFLPPPLSTGSYQGTDGAGGEEGTGRGGPRSRRLIAILCFRRRVRLPGDKDEEEEL